MSLFNFIKAFIKDFLHLSFAPVEVRHTPVEPVTAPIDITASTQTASTTVMVDIKKKPTKTPKSLQIYTAAVAGMNKHLALDNNVPTEVGCVQAVSVVLKNAGYPIPAKGLYAVNELIAFALAHGMKETKNPKPGDVVTAHQPAYNNPSWAHCGIMAKNGILNNNSMTGKFTLSYTRAQWERYFGGRGSKTRYFTAVDN